MDLSDLERPCDRAEDHSPAGDPAGEEVFIANRAWHPDLANLHEDFWLYDHSMVVRMIYDDEGHLLHPERGDDLPRYLEVRAPRPAARRTAHRLPA